jgi:hypothetical protein
MDWLRRSCSVTIAVILSAVLLHITAWAQTVPSAYGPAHPLWVGADYSNIAASFPYQSSQRLVGAGVFADVKLYGHIGLEGDVRFMRFGGFQGSTESSYLAGPKANFFARGRFLPYGKLLVGLGKIHYPFEIGDANYCALAPGGGLGFRLSRHWMLRADYEYQIWPNSPEYGNEPKHELTPNGLQVGVAYRVFR